ncbi:MAG: hypothetical protein AAGJ87_13455 [Pseudomonadota bacterium]
MPDMELMLMSGTALGLLLLGASAAPSKPVVIRTKKVRRHVRR